MTFFSLAIVRLFLTSKSLVIFCLLFSSVDYIYTMEFYAAERKKELIPFATAWMELESIILSEISQTVRDKYHMISPLTGTS